MIVWVFVSVFYTPGKSREIFVALKFAEKALAYPWWLIFHSDFEQ